MTKAGDRGGGRGSRESGGRGGKTTEQKSHCKEMDTTVFEKQQSEEG